MSASSNYSSLSTTTKRFIWLGYLAYLVYIWLLDGFDDLIENIVPVNNDILYIAVAFGLYWIIVFLILWATDN